MLKQLLKDPKSNLLEGYNKAVGEMERGNVENCDHFEQLCKHEHEIVANKNSNNTDELAEYKNNLLQQIDSTLPPFRSPNSKIVEPFAELEDYLDKDDFSNLLSILG